MPPITRRQFIRSAAGLTVPFFGLPHLRYQRESFDVIVIGAGVAGIAAAATLQAAGARVVILEARDRIGGRVWSDEVAGVPVDLGASWIHGTDGNPITELARANGVELTETDYDDSNRDDDEVWEQVEADLETFDEYRESLNEDTSVYEALSESMQDPSQLQDPQGRALYTALIEHEYAADLEELSAWYFDAGGGFDGADALMLGGYRGVFAPIAATIDIRLNTPALRINYGRDGVTVRTPTGDFGAPQAVITLPLGVLKRQPDLFDPPLPAAKRTAIDRLGMGTLDKLIVRFPEVFWDDNEIISLGSENGLAWTESVNIAAYNDEPMLMMFNAGSFARELEGMTDTQVVASALDHLRSEYGAIPAPTDFRFTRWSTDPHAFGSYSYQAVGSTPDDRDSLAAIVADRLFFAGEATHRDYSATVHGAWLSGIRAAEEIWEA